MHMYSRIVYSLADSSMDFPPRVTSWVFVSSVRSPMVITLEAWGVRFLVMARTRAKSSSKSKGFTR